MVLLLYVSSPKALVVVVEMNVTTADVRVTYLEIAASVEAVAVRVIEVALVADVVVVTHAIAGAHHLVLVPVVVARAPALVTANVEVVPALGLVLRGA
jgi:hypothetical protein